MSAAWTWGGRAVLAVNYDQAVRNVDSREHLTLTVEVPKERSGTRLMSLLWYGRTQNLVACGNNAMMQEREFQLLDLRLHDQMGISKKVDSEGS